MAAEMAAGPVNAGSVRDLALARIMIAFLDEHSSLLLIDSDEILRLAETEG